MTFTFVKGDEVVLRAGPDLGTGVVADVLIAGSEPAGQGVLLRRGADLQLADNQQLEPPNRRGTRTPDRIIASDS